MSDQFVYVEGWCGCELAHCIKELWNFWEIVKKYAQY